MTAARPLISLVVPVFNEEENVLPFYEATSLVMDSLSDSYDFEIVFSDNHSTDNTPALLRQLAARDTRVRAYRLSRNFGYQRSIMTAYLKTRGDIAMQLDCDLQDPPSLLPLFLDEWRKGADVVYGVRTKRAEAWHITFVRKVFYRLIDFLSEEHMPHDAGDFRLITRRIIEELRTIDDAQPYIRGTIATLGFKQVGIPYTRDPRVRGESKFSLYAMTSLAFDGIMNHSVVPLRVATYVGLAASLLTVLAMVAYTVAKFFFGTSWPAGFTTLTVLVLGTASLNAMLLGIIGEYLGRIYQQVRKKPLSIIEEELHLTPRNSLV